MYKIFALFIYMMKFYNLIILSIDFRWEVSEIWKANIAKSINMGLFQSASVVISMALFGTAWYTGVPLSAQRIYSTLGWVFCLRLTIFLFMMYLVEDNKQLASSLKRIQVNRQ